MEELGDENRSPPLVAAGLRPIGAVGWQIRASSAGSETSNHEVTAFRLWERGVGFKPTKPHPAPDLKTCRAAFWATLPEGDQYPEGNYHDLVSAVAADYPSGPGTNQGETAFDMCLFWALKSYLGDMVDDTETNKASGKDLSTIVLKGQWVFDGATCQKVL